LHFLDLQNVILFLSVIFSLYHNIIAKN